MKRRQIPPVRKPVKNNLPSGTAKHLSEMLQRGLGHHQQGNLKEAANLYEQILKINPNHFDALQLLGGVLGQLGKYNKALEHFEKALKINKNFAGVYCNYGNVLRELGRPEEALVNYDSAIKLKNDYSDAYNNKGNALKDLKKYDLALISYEKAVALNPENPSCFNNIGSTFFDLRQYERAVLYFDRAIQLNPNYAEPYYNRAQCLKFLKRIDEAIAGFEKAKSLKSNYDFLDGNLLYSRMQICDWKEFNSLTASIVDDILNLKKAAVPFSILAVVDSLMVHKTASNISANNDYTLQNPTYKSSATNYIEKIKIGYFSADFHEHATMHLMAEMFEYHNKNRFEIFAFSYGPASSDQWQDRAKKSFSEFIDCNNKSDSEIAKISADLGVHIAVDLKGFTTDSRTGIFAHRAAPIQVNFIGYPGTMGADYIDYIIADEVLIPEESHQFYSEKVAYLPDCYQPNCRNRAVSNKSISRSDFSLPENGIVFSSFNNNYKITPDIFASWIRILKKVDGSVLWLLTSNATAENNLRRYMEEGGVDPARLIFAQKLPIEEHLNRLRLADLMLDTFPCGAHTTCSDALRMGLPVVALMGQSFASRVAASLLTTVGLPELITASLSDYESLAIELAKSPEKLADIRARLQRNFESTPLFNPELFARNLESLYETMYRRHCDGLPADHIRIPSVAV